VFRCRACLKNLSETETTCPACKATIGIHPCPTKEEFEANNRAAHAAWCRQLREIVRKERDKLPEKGKLVMPVLPSEDSVKRALEFLTSVLTDPSSARDLAKVRHVLDKILEPRAPAIPGVRPAPSHGEAVRQAEEARQETKKAPDPTGQDPS
jgi:hypothetical protein